MIEYENVIKAIDNLLKAADDDLTDKLKNAGYINPEDTIDDINRLEDGIAEILDDELNYFLKGLEGIDIENAIDEILQALFSGDLTDEQLAELFKKEFDTIMRKLTDAYIKDYDKELAFSMFSDRTTDWINSWSEDLGKLMKLTSHDELKRILNNGLEDGESLQQVMDNLMESYGFSRKRARATALTEILTAHSYSKEEAIRQSPAVDRKEWRHTGEHKIKPRPHHQALDGTVIPKTEKFIIAAPSGTYEALFPRDIALPASERVNCHCIHRGIANDDIMGLSLEERRKLQQQAIDDDNGKWEKELDAQNRARAGIE